MRKLILLGAFVLPLFGAGVAQAAPGDLPANCAITGSAVQCVGQVAVQDLVGFFSGLLSFTVTGSAS